VKKDLFLLLTTLVLLSLVVGACGPTPEPTAEPTEVPTEEPPPAPDCVDFEDLPLGTVYGVGDVFVTSGVQVAGSDFQWGSGDWTSDGFAEVGNAGDAGGSGQEMIVNNLLLKFDFGGPVAGLRLRFGEYGGNLNIDINGEFVNFENFADINGAVIDGVSVSVVNGLGNDQGILTLVGTINSFAIGGQELVIDDVCPGK
jgi:hypothetical protein